MDPANGSTNVNAWEYCDDTNSLTIVGVVTNVTYANPSNDYSNIKAFDVLVTVNNNLPVEYDYVLNATNSHGEVLQQPGNPGTQNMADTRITAEFAIADITMLPSGIPPYFLDPVSAGSYYIEAVNEDEWAWYCWAPDSEQQPAGQFQVPAWNLAPSTIPPGDSARVTMQFKVTDSGIPVGDYRHSVIRASAANGWDVLYNRHPSLKISHWLDTLLIDNGYNYASTPPPPWWEEEPVEYVYASDASVFYNPEEPEESHKMHYAQLPDPNGWDVRACNYIEDGLQKVLADDFRCTASGPITNITFWGSWFNDEFDDQDPFQGITNIHLSIHGDIPDPDGEGPEYSKPNLPALKEWELDPRNLPTNWDIQITTEESSVQGWYDPNHEHWEYENHMQYFRYDITIPEEEAFVQVSNTIYWLDVSLNIAEGPYGELYQWGWKTSITNWNDDATWTDMPVLDPLQWNELVDPRPENTNSLDLAFLIDGPEQQLPDEYDWGDLPDTYNTTAANSGANHITGPTYSLGTLIDSEADGLPTTNAVGDDQNGSNDEDGIVFTSLCVPGQNLTFNATASAAGQLDIWMDLNLNGTWDLPVEHVFSSGVISGSNPLSFLIPYGTPSGQNYLRYRFTSSSAAYPGGAPLPTGNATDGEVEDYTVQVEELDWGDAPDTPYPTLAANSGANHLIRSSIYLGTAVDAETNGQPNATATGDDNATSDDEDGVTFNTPFFPGTVAQIDITAVGSGLLNGWIDLNADGDWNDSGEQIFTDRSLSAGTTTLNIQIPTHAAPATNTFMRLRYSTVSGLQPTGYASNGEVEDYLIETEEQADIDWGDLPQPGYPVTGANNGAHHAMTSARRLGTSVDGEPDGQPNINAEGDDKNLSFPGIAYPPGDEDGVILNSATLMPGGYVSVDVIASQPGVLDAWLDFNVDNSFAQTGDQIFSGQALTAGTNSLLFPVPLTAATNGAAAHARFRFTSGSSAYPGGTAVPTGLANDGEVEDYHWLISQLDSGTDYGDAPDSPYPTLSTSLGAAHSISAGRMLGAVIDTETNGLPTTAANGDDTDDFDDEDGVTFATKIVSGDTAGVAVVSGVSGGLLDAWVDFNADGDWNDAGEQIFTSSALSPGLNNLSFPVPLQPTLQLGPSYARFRISSTGALPPTGPASTGEVEDYAVDLYQPAPTHLVITNLTVIPSNSVATIEWTAESNIHYQVQCSSNLLTNIWTDVGGWVFGPVNWQTHSAVLTQQFYRVTVPNTQ